MQNYIKTFRVLSLAILSILILTVIWGAGYVVFEDEYIEGLALLLFLIPIYIVGKYILLTVKGEEAVEQLSIKAKKTILYSNMVALAVLIIMPLMVSGYLLKDYLEKEAKMQQISQDVITWPEEQVLGETVKIKTRWNNEELKVILTSEYDKPAYTQEYDHIIVFRDSDGFEIISKRAYSDSYSNIRDGKGGQVIGVKAEFEFYVPAEKYMKVQSLDVLIIER